MMIGKIVNIYIAPESGVELQSISAAELEAGRGIVGDRYYTETGTFSEKLRGLPDHEITLIESEQIDKFNREQGLALTYGELRRNIITKDIRLNDLEGREFTIGSIRLKGIRLCEPCNHLAQIVSSEVLPHFVHKAGLRAAILDNGKIMIGEEITVS